MKYIASCSFGKDSIAQILLALDHDEPLDEIVYCEVMFDEEISGEQPEHIKFVREVAIPYFESRGLKVTVVRSDKNYMSNFDTRIVSGPRTGLKRGFPIASMCTINRDCKTAALNKYMKTSGEHMKYIGIASDEIGRLASMNENEISLLDKYSVTEEMAYRMCEVKGLLSPIYKFSYRNGCWFCPNIKIDEWIHLYKNNHEYFLKLVELGKDKELPSNLITRKETPRQLYKRIARESKQTQLSIFGKESK